MPSRWDIVDVDFGVPVGHVQGNRRPALIVSNDGLNHHARLVTICPFTGRTPARYPSEVDFPAVGGLSQPSTLLGQQIRTVSVGQVVAQRGSVQDPVLRRRVEEALIHLLDLAP